MSLQEKFQTILPSAPNEDDGTEWTDINDSLQTIESRRYKDNTTATEDVSGKYNQMPSTNLTSRLPFVRVLAGSTDVSEDTNPESMQDGYTYLPMSPCDDQYTGEHAEHFYGEAVGPDGHVGFAERNNYLDRE
jgi:hypothetical protein